MAATAAVSLLSPKSSAPAAPASPLTLRHIFGLKGDCHTNLHYVDDATVVYPAGAQLVLANVDKRTQRFLALTAADDTTASSGEVTCLAVSTPKHSHAKGKLLAIAEYRQPQPNLMPVALTPSQPSTAASATFATPFQPQAHPTPSTSLTIYDLSTLKRKGKSSLTLPTETGPIVSLAFSPDTKTLLSLTAAPNPTLALWQWEKAKLLTSTLIPSSSPASFFITQPAAAPLWQTTMASFCPTDPAVVCLSGPGLLRFLHIEQNEFRSIPFTMQHSNATTASSSSSALPSADFTCHCWLDDRLLVGTREGDLHLFENAEYRGILAGSPSLIANGGSSSGNGKGGCAVSWLSALSKGFLCGYGEGMVVMYERDEKDIYKQSKCYQVKTREGEADDGADERQRGGAVTSAGEEEDENDEDDDDFNQPTTLITNIAISPTEDSCILSLSTNESFHLSLSSSPDGLSLSGLSMNKTRKDKERYEQQMLTANSGSATSSFSLFDSLSLSHSSPILSLSIATRKPLFLTSSADRTVKVWNWLTRQVEFTSSFPTVPLAVSFHASAHYVLLSFASHIRLCSLYLDDFHSFKSFGHRSATVVKFSRGGQYWLCCSENMLYVYDTYRCTQLLMMNKHKAAITDACFTDNDSEVVTVSKDGYVYRSVVHGGGGGAGGGDGVVLVGKYKCGLLRVLLCGDNYYLATDEKEVKVLTLNGANDPGAAPLPSSNSNSLSSAYNRHTALANTVPTTVTLIPLKDDISSIVLLHHLPSSASSTASSLASSAPSRERLLVTGTENGNVVLTPLPFDSNNPRQQTIRLFHKRVAAFTLSLDQSLLFAVSDDACVAIVDVARSALAGGSSGGGVGGEDKKSSALSFSEESLISSSSLLEQQQLLAHLHNTLAQLSSQHQQLLAELESNYKKRLKELSDRYEREIETDKKKYKVEEEEKAAVERQYMERDAELKSMMARKRQELIEAHGLRMGIEEERYAELKAELERKKREWADEIQQRQQDYAKEREELEANKRRELEELKAMEEQVRVEKDQLIAEYEYQHERMESLTDEEINQWKVHYHHKLHTDKQQTVQLKDQHLSIKHEFQSVKQELNSNYQLLTKKQNTHHSLSLALSSSQLSLSALEKENAERSHTIVDKQHRMFELKKKNQELEKFRFVLDYKIVELKRQIAPKRNERLRLSEEKSVMESEVREYEGEYGRMTLEVREMQMKADGMEREMRRREEDEREWERVLVSCWNELTALYNKMTDDDSDVPQEVRKKEAEHELRRLYSKYVVDDVTVKQQQQKERNKLQPIKPPTPTSTPPGTVSYAAAESEHLLYQQHVSALQNRVSAYLNKMKQDSTIADKERNKRRQENIQLTLQVNGLRREREIMAAGGLAAVSEARGAGKRRGWADEEKEEQEEREKNVRQRTRRMLEEEVEYQAELIRQLTEQTKALTVEDSRKEEAEDKEDEEEKEEQQEEEREPVEILIPTDSTEVVV